MFRGVQHINMDAKGRMAIPAKYRERLLAECDGQLIATIDTQSRCLLIYPLPTWELIEKEIQSLPSLNPAVRRFQRLLIGYASELEFDGNGRVLLSPSLREYASLDKKVVLVGQGKKLELWNESMWLQERDKWLDEVGGEQALPDEMLSLSL
ncbi:MAG: division/cell wall cluster transcriptional repressor MraZ [Spongiibacteraceae bacterium]|nr:division/cell wall cluster transcriptional repressor MraZ [Spongiibacteraceae bacterium]